MSTIYFDTHLGDEERRRRLYSGDVFVYSPRPSTRALTEFARSLIEEAFAPLDPVHAQDSLPVERFVEIVGPLKPRFIHHPRTKELLLELLRDIGCDMEKTYFDVPRMRVATSGGYLSAGVAYVLHPHRDIWYSSPPCQLNWWLPVFPFESESSFAFHPKYWDVPVANSSDEYNHYEWNKVGRANASKEVKADTASARGPPSSSCAGPRTSRRCRRRSSDCTIRIRRRTAKGWSISRRRRRCRPAGCSATRGPVAGGSPPSSPPGFPSAWPPPPPGSPCAARGARRRGTPRR